MSGPLKALVVDDHPLFRMGLRYALRSQGFDVVGEASDGSEAVAACREMRARLPANGES